MAVGDIIGKPGRRALSYLLPDLRQKQNIDLVIANAENAAGGIGLTPQTAEDLLQSGVDVLTSGNHIWDKKDIIPYLDTNKYILRPLNYPPDLPGHGYVVKGETLIVNLIGRTFIGNFDCPFRAMDSLLEKYKNKVKFVIIDFHAEATSEKSALGRYLDGRVSAVLGTHTHVGTTDAGVLPRGTAYITDIGMTGPKDSIIGDDIDSVLNRFLTLMPHRLSVGKGNVICNYVILELDETTGMARSIKHYSTEVDHQILSG